MTSNGVKGGNRYRSSVFTELGIAMLSSVLRSDKAIQTNIEIMRTFFELRRLLDRESSLVQRVDSIERETDQLFELVFQRLDQLEIKVPSLPSDRKKIGI